MINSLNIDLPEISEGDFGPYVQYLSLALRRAGYGNTIYNQFNNSLRQELVEYQTKNNLISDGIAGINTWRNILKYLTGYVIIGYTDDLEGVAETYSTTVDAIQTANPNLMSGGDIVVPFGYNIVPVDVDYTYALCIIIADGLTKRYPFVEQEVIGKSVMQKDIFCLEMGNGEDEIFINASHHANEWITTPLTLKFAEDFCIAFVNNDSIYTSYAPTLFASRRIFIVPLVNPDGVDLVNGAIDRQSSFYQNAEAISRDYPAIPFPNGWKANILGTDPNLNYPAGWDEARRIKFAQGYTSPAPRDYVGTAPLSSPESRSIFNFTLNHNFLLTISYHTQGGVIYWRYLDYMPPNSLEIGEALSQASGYTLETTPTQSGYAGYKDWFISYYNLPGYTVEAGSGINPLPISQFAEIYADNLPLIATAIELAEQ